MHMKTKRRVAWLIMAALLVTGMNVTPFAAASQNAFAELANGSKGEETPKISGGAKSE